MEMVDIRSYETIVFDCDGVILDSNKVKTNAFRESVLGYGDEAANRFVEYHVANGGVSRYKKFEYFLTEIAANVKDYESEYSVLLANYQRIVRDNLLTCDLNPLLEKLRAASEHINWLVASGGDQVELRDVFSERGIDIMFQGGIFGSPDTKDVILSREMGNSNVKLPALFIGDSKYDHLAASNAGLDFLFYAPWTEFSGWEDYCKELGLPVVHSFSELM